MRITSVNRNTEGFKGYMVQPKLKLTGRVDARSCSRGKTLINFPKRNSHSASELFTEEFRDYIVSKEKKRLDQNVIYK